MGTKVKVQNYQLHELWNAMTQLDGRAELAEDSNGKKTIIVKPYSFEDFKVTYAIAKTKALIRPSVIAYEDALKKLQDSAQKADTTNDEADNKRVKDDADIKRENDLRDLARMEIEIEVHMLKLEALKVNENKLAPGLIFALLPMLVDREVEV